MNDMEWGYNCLTSGIHHGRPEAIWNLSLLHTSYMFSPAQLQKLVVDRVYSDAMEFVTHSDATQEWAYKVKELAGPSVLRTFQHTIGELSTYYASPECRQGLDEAIKLSGEGKLNAHYTPLHNHDSLNMLCRIIGTSASRQASQ